MGGKAKDICMKQPKNQTYKHANKFKKSQIKTCPQRKNERRLTCLNPSSGRSIDLKKKKYFLKITTGSCPSCKFEARVYHLCDPQTFNIPFDFRQLKFVSSSKSRSRSLKEHIFFSTIKGFMVIKLQEI